MVDTPGTNVIVDRQQRLTEEFVPRSDLVLFIMSSDRPFTESEVCTAMPCAVLCGCMPDFAASAPKEHSSHHCLFKNQLATLEA